MLTNSHKLLLAALWAAIVAPAAAHAAEERANGGAPSRASIVLAAPQDFDAGVKAVAAATGAKPQKLGVPGVPLREGCAFAVEPRVAERLLSGTHRTFRKAGLYLFRYERSYGLEGEKDLIVLMRTADWRAVVRRIGTADADNEKVAAWLEALAKEEPFELWEIGADYLLGQFERTPKNPAAIARKSAELAPELVAGGPGRIDLLAREIAENRTLYLIW
jgi:hypothetical protein